MNILGKEIQIIPIRQETDYTPNSKKKKDTRLYEIETITPEGNAFVNEFDPKNFYKK